MHFLSAFVATSLLALVLPAAAQAQVALSAAQQQFQTELAAKVEALEKKNVSAIAGTDGWLFLTNELRFLAQGRFWGEAAAKAARSSKSPDPLPAITDFHRQLRDRGIELLLVPVPPKAAIYADKLGADPSLRGNGAAPHLQEFYAALRTRGVEVLDLAPMFLQDRDGERGSVFCRTDSHWSGAGTVLAAEAIAKRIQAKLPAPAARKNYDTEWKQAAITGDLAGLLAADAAKADAEKLTVRTVVEKGSGAAVQPDAESPVLLMGDSHTLVFHDFLAERAGLVDQLAHELGFPPDLIGTRGSGATAVRVSLYRKTRSDPNFLAKKKLIVWCFASREFTEADQGWVQQPIGK